MERRTAYVSVCCSSLLQRIAIANREREVDLKGLCDERFWVGLVPPGPGSWASGRQTEKPSTWTRETTGVLDATCPASQ